jgi:flagellar M-ring protein FliF
MATGIQTGMQRGSRSGISRGGSALGKGAPGGGGGPLGKLSEIWKGLGKGMRIGILSLVAILVVGGVGFGLHSSANQYVDLYPTKMTLTDVNEVSAALTQMRIDHQVNITSDGIVLHPSKRGQAQGALAQLGLPRQPVLTPDKVEGGMGKTAIEQEATRQQLLEGDITLAFRAMEGVNDAQVKLAIPKKTYFQDDNKQTTARVLLNLRPEASLNRDKIKGMVNMVAASVPELKPENVTILDTTGRDLTAMIPKDEQGGFVASGTNLEVQAAEEKRLQQKAQEALDAAMPGKTKVTVNLDMDFSKVEKENFTPGGAADDGVVRQSHQIKREVLDRSGATASGEDATQLSGGGGKNAGGDYTHEVESANYLVAQQKTKTVDLGFRVRRLTASVVADNVSETELAAIAGTVGPAIGLDEARGDQITVTNIAFDKGPMVATDPGMAMAGAGMQQQGASEMPTGALAMVAVAGAGMMLVVLGMFLFKQHSVRGDQGTIITSTAGSITSTAITDHFTDKSGKTTAPTSSAGATQVNTTDQLEQLVKERPTKVAEMLKSTWLSS